MISLEVALVLALLAGSSIPAGALISATPLLATYCRRLELDSFVSYFGGGALLAAIALVLIPRGIEDSSVLLASFTFALGGLVFWQFSAWTMRTENTASQFMGMVLDFFPEAILLGVAAANGSNVAYLLAILIALQNMPEGFAAHHEMRESGISRGRLWTMFLLAPLLGPLAAWIGFAWLSGSDQVLASVLLFCSGGILYLIFEDLAPGAHSTDKSFPAIGAILGFLLGMVGTMMIH
ncbi:MAG: divalent cation transporter [Gammaproteobacteria bacterium]